MSDFKDLLNKVRQNNLGTSAPVTQPRIGIANSIGLPSATQRVIPIADRLKAIREQAVTPTFEDLAREQETVQPVTIEPIEGLYSPSTFLPVLNSVSPNQKSKDKPLYKAAASAFGTSWTGLMNVLEPLQLPKAFTDAVIAGALDEDTTIAERLASINWAAGINPLDQRQLGMVQGKEIMELLGVENNVAKNILGGTWDFVGDPLLLVPVLNIGIAGAKGLAISGKLGGAADDVMRGIKVVEKFSDNFGDLVNAFSGYGLPVSAKRIISRVAPETNKFIDARVAEAMKELVDPNAWWNERLNLTNVVTGTLAKKKAFQIKLGDIAGAGLFDARARANQEGTTVAGKLANLQEEAVANLFGISVSDPANIVQQTGRAIIAKNPTRTVFERVEKILGGVAKAGQPLDNLNQEMYSIISREAQSIIDGRGSIWVDDLTKGGQLPELADIAKVNPKYPSGLPNVIDSLETATEKIFNEAKRMGFAKPDDIARKFRAYVDDMTRIDALAGFYASGMPQFKNSFQKSLYALGASPKMATELYQSVLQKGINGTSKELRDIGTGLNIPRSLSNLTDIEKSRAVSSYNAFKNRLKQDTTQLNDKIFNTRIKGVEDKAANLISKLTDLGQDDLVDSMMDTVVNYNTATHELYKSVRSGKTYAELLASDSSYAEFLKQGEALRSMKKEIFKQVKGEDGKEIRDLASALLRDHNQLNVNGFKRLRVMKKEVARRVEDANNGYVDPANRVVEIIKQRRLEKGIGVEGEVRIGELLDSFQDAYGLPIETYLNKQRTGHIARTFAITQDAAGADAYAKALQVGKVFTSNIIDEGAIAENVSGAAGKAMANYFANVGRSGAEGAHGFIVTQKELINHMVNNGIKPADAKTAIGELITYTNPRMDKTIRRVQDISAQMSTLEQKAVLDGRRLESAGRATFSKRKELDLEYLTELGELVDPNLSLLSTQRTIKNNLKAPEFLSLSYDVAVETGNAIHKLEGDAPRGWKLVTSNVMGQYKDHYVHPYFHQELMKGLTKKAGIPNQALNKLRALTTGAWLTAPNTNAANFLGGVMTSLMNGANPITLTRSLARTAKIVADELSGRASHPLMKNLKEHMVLKESGANYQFVYEALEDIKQASSGLDFRDANSLMGSATKMYENFLARPLGQAWAGLDGFMFIEEWLKAANFDAHLLDNGFDAIKNFDAIDVDNILAGAEVARTAVYDYTELPDFLELAKSIGITPFVGFQYFTMGRTLSAAMNHPEVLASLERLPDAVSNMTTLSEEDKLAIFVNMPDWLQDSGSVILDTGYDRNPDGSQGARFARAIPTSTLIPHKSITPEGFGGVVEGAAQAGVWSAFGEAITAFWKDGEAVYSGRYGARVYEADAEGLEKYKQAGEFLLSSFAPSVLRRLGVTASDLGKISRDDRSGGILGAMRNQARIPEGIADAIYSIDEAQRQRASRSLADEAIAFTLRSPQLIYLEGSLQNIASKYEQEKRDHSMKQSPAKKRLERLLTLAQVNGDMAAQRQADQIIDELALKDMEFNERWLMHSDIMEQAGYDFEAGEVNTRLPDPLSEDAFRR